MPRWPERSATSLAEADLPVRLVEIGTSAGLNLRADQFWISGAGVSFGPESSPVRMPGAWHGQPPPVRPVEVVSRTGGDLAPVDPVSEQGRLLLLAYVWADQVDRLDRLRGACELAARIPADLRREAASQTIARTQAGTWHLDGALALDLPAVPGRGPDSRAGRAE